jgi:hypothetical protein
MLLLIQLVQSDTQLFVPFNVSLACGSDRLARIPLSCLHQPRCGQQSVSLRSRLLRCKVRLPCSPVSNNVRYKMSSHQTLFFSVHKPGFCLSPNFPYNSGRSVRAASNPSSDCYKTHIQTHAHSVVISLTFYFLSFISFFFFSLRTETRLIAVFVDLLSITFRRATSLPRERVW